MICLDVLLLTVAIFEIITIDAASLSNTNPNKKCNVIKGGVEKCTDSQWRCASGECLENEYLCDSIVDCKDGSDETYKNCKNIECPSYLFKCTYGACIDKNKVCDGYEDCADGSDELKESCRRLKKLDSCPQNTWRCSDGECIKKILLCDGTVNCKDGSDETEENCFHSVCDPYLFKCNYGACVNGDAKCNGISECADGSDEDSSICSYKNSNFAPSKVNSKYTWNCKNGQLIHLNKLCDGKPDCIDESDETYYACRNNECQSYLYQCYYGACIGQHQKCDGKTDCADNSDETECFKHPTKNTCSRGGFRCGSGECIERSRLCDGISDCDDISDETYDQCFRLDCASYLFKCDYGGCINADATCNGIADCHDGSDENVEMCNEKKVTPLCQLPEPLEAKTYFTKLADDPYRTMAAIVVCDNGYTMTSICRHGKWIQDIYCPEKCSKPVPSTGLNLKCYRSGRSEIPCTLGLYHGYSIAAKCEGSEESVRLHCTGGTWSAPLPDCEERPRYRVDTRYVDRKDGFEITISDVRKHERETIRVINKSNSKVVLEEDFGEVFIINGDEGEDILNTIFNESVNVRHSNKVNITESDISNVKYT